MNYDIKHKNIINTCNLSVIGSEQLIVREYKKQDLFSVAKVHVDTWNSTYINIIPEKYLKNRTYEIQQKKWEDRILSNPNTNEFMFVLENDGEVVGFSTGAMNDKDCKIDSILYTLYILKEYQSKGYGKLLVKAVASKLRCLGAKNMLLWVLADNSTCKFYEYLGGKQGEIKTVNIGGADLVEVSYEWDDITSLTD